MIATYVIGLCEGLEAALIVGIVAAARAPRERRDGSRIDSGGHLMSLGMRNAALGIAAIAAAGLAGCGSTMSPT